ncbi:MAG TPA: transcriptional repressor [Phycisphaerales bacterium]|nr:transcriptional repressor [Phycisphaerales bacterium]HMP35936.1 transcriptional repressor [Phycisphaerales bacterium]
MDRGEYSTRAILAANNGRIVGTLCEIIAPERAILEQRGVRPTRQRIAILAALRACVGEHPTAEELHRSINADADEAHSPRGIRSRRAISLATVYNTLETLQLAGLCRVLRTAHGRRWDSGTHDHVHLRLADDNSVEDLPAELGRRLLAAIGPELLRAIERDLGVTVDGVSIELEGRRAPRSPVEVSRPEADAPRRAQARTLLQPT